MAQPTAGVASLVVEADWNVWAPVPISLPQGRFQDLGQWADAVVDAATEEDWTANERQRLKTFLLSIGESAHEDELRFVNLADPLRNVYYVSVLCWDSEFDLSVESLAGDEIDGAVRKPNVESFESPAFAQGARGVVFQDTGGDNHDIGGTARWALRDHGVDVVGLLNMYNVYEFGRQLPIVDEFMRAVAVAAEPGTEAVQ